MTKTELVSGIATASGLTQAEASRALNATVQEITQALAKEDTVSIVGFGTFKTSHRKARTGRNPKTGAAIQIKAARIPKFVPGKGLKDTVK